MTPTTETIDAANARTPLTTLARSLGIATTFIIPALLLRFSGIQATRVLSLVIYGAAVIGASFLLAWAAEAAQIDVSGGLAIAVLALNRRAAGIRGRPVLRLHRRPQPRL